MIYLRIIPLTCDLASAKLPKTFEVSSKMNLKKIISCMSLVSLLLCSFQSSVIAQMPYLSPVPERKYAFYPSMSFCGTGYLSLFSDMGNVSGLPLELKYHDDPVTDSDSEVWKKWHARVADSINSKFAALSARFDANGKLVVRHASYTISSNRKIEPQKIAIIYPERVMSGSDAFQKMIDSAIKELEGDPALEFPPNTKSNLVISKGGRFSQNYGPAVIAELKKEKPSQNPASPQSND